MSTLDTVRTIVGRRHKIAKQEMIDILLALPMDIVPASTITGRGQDGRLHVGGEWISNPADEARATATAWAKACRRITCISVLPTSYFVGDSEEMVEGLGVRYDDPGSMAPSQHAELMFAPEGLDYEYLRRHADRVLIVSEVRGAEFRKRLLDEPTQARLR